jgi:hypothetical protein
MLLAKENLSINYKKPLYVMRKLFREHHIGLRKLDTVYIEGLIINNTIFYELERNTVIAIGWLKPSSLLLLCA